MVLVDAIKRIKLDSFGNNKLNVHQQKIIVEEMTDNRIMMLSKSDLTNLYEMDLYDFLWTKFTVNLNEHVKKSEDTEHWQKVS